jgi:hypothetical protein
VSEYIYYKDNRNSRAIAQAVSRRVPTVEARIQTRVWSCGILRWTKVALGQVFSENFGFPCQSTFHLLLQARSGRSANSLKKPNKKKDNRMNELQKLNYVGYKVILLKTW